MPRPALTRSRAISVGLSVVSELGLEALTLDAVARRVRSTPGGVQRVLTVTELVEEVVTEIAQAMPTVPAGGNRARRLRQWAMLTREWLVGYPGLARYLLANRWDIPVALDRLEALVEVIDSRRLEPEQGFLSGLALYCFVLSSADGDETTRVLGGEFSNRRTDASTKTWPRLSAHVNDYSIAFADTQFSFALDLFLRGIDQLDAVPEP